MEARLPLSIGSPGLFGTPDECQPHRYFQGMPGGNSFSVE